MRVLKPLLTLALAAAAAAALVAPALAHAAYKSSDPPDDGQVSSPPAEVTATFTEPLAEGSFLQITDPCGERVDGGDVRIVGYDMSVSMTGAAAGRYTVFYRAFSTLDPHVTEGTFGFTASGGDGCAAPAPPSDQRGSTDGGSNATDDGSRSDDGSSGPVDVRSAGSEASSRTDRASAARSDRGSPNSQGTARKRSGTGSGSEQDDVRLAAETEETKSPSVWDGIRLEPFLTGLLLAAIIGAAGGKMYAGIMGPRA